MKKNTKMLRPPAEILYKEELAFLNKWDPHPKPPGWKLSPKTVRIFILGSDTELSKGKSKKNISKKFYGDDILIDRCLVTLMSNRGLILVGEPGTAKTMLSEFLTAAICGASTYTIQGTVGTNEDHIKYSWNYAQLLAEGPSHKALVPSPLYKGLSEGLVVRFEEITRCPPEIQDTLISILSDKVMLIPELGDKDSVLYAQNGFNIIATANIRDRGVNEMSSALKRRFNFETVYPIADKKLELQLVKEQTDALLREVSAKVEINTKVLDLLVTTFHELRNGTTEEGAILEKPSTILSTAEAVAVGFSAGLDACYFGQGSLAPEHIVRQLSGTVLKDNPEDAKKLKHYFNTVAKMRAKKEPRWKAFFEARKWLHLQ